MKLGDPVKHALDWTAFWGTIAWATALIPPILGLLSLIWLTMQMYEWCINKRWKKETERRHNEQK